MHSQIVRSSDHESEFSRKSGRWSHLRWTGLSLAWLVCGCGGPTTEPPATPPATAPAPAATEESATSAAPTTLPAPAAEPQSQTETAPEFDPAAVAAFQKLTDNSISAEEFEATQEELLSLGAKAVPVVGQALDSSRDLERELASTILVLLGPEAIVPVEARLVEALQDSSGFVRGNAASVLILTSDHAEKSVATLLQLLESDDLGLRQLAAMNLQAQPELAAAHLPQLITRLQVEEQATVLVPLIELMGVMGSQAVSATEALQQLAASTDDNVRPAASTALQQLNGIVQQTQGTVAQ